MSLFRTFMRNIPRPSSKHLLYSGAFAIALAASISLGLAARGSSSATVSRDCDTNSIDYAAYPGAGDCGAANPAELVQDIRHNSPSDLQSFYGYFGLNSGNYDQFASSAKEGVVNRDGTVVVNGQTVMTGVDTYGRKSWGNPNRKPITINGHTYYHAAPSTSFASGVQSIPAMVLFDNNGVAQVAVMNPCGNEITGTKVQNGVTCKALNYTQPDQTHKPNTYDFTTSATTVGNANISRVVYHFSDDNSTITKNSLNDAVEHTFTKDADVTVTVYASVPGGHEIQAAQVIACQKHITYVPPFYVCSNLLATALDDQKKSFRFTVIAKTDTTGQTTLQSADFTLDNVSTTSGVTTKDTNGNIYKDYGFTDENSHTVVAKVNFNTVQGVQSVTCQATVTPAKTPKCTVPGHENEAPNSPTCGYCQPGIPIGDTRCTPPPSTPPQPPQQLVNTGPGATFGLFGAAVIAGFVGHKLFLSRRVRRAAEAAVTIDQ